jgi:hypothetical protein
MSKNVSETKIFWAHKILQTGSDIILGHALILKIFGQKIILRTLLT